MIERYTRNILSRWWRKPTVGLLAILISPVGLTQSTTESINSSADQTEQADIPFSNITGGLDNPKRHSRLRRPATLTSDQAETIYQQVRGALQIGYKTSKVGILNNYQTWQRFNTTPYRSISHGNHYLNNYGNDIAHVYSAYENAGIMPIGSIIVKDSFSVTSDREIILGAMFVMEKMEAGFNHVTDDWKYSQIQPEGTLLGETNGIGSGKVEYCILCHLARKSYDHLYFIPAEHRAIDSE